MFFLNKQESVTLIVVCGVIIGGSVLQFVSTHFPYQWRQLDFISGNKCFIKVNVNQATPEELDKVPNLGLSTAGRIVSYRNEHGPFKSIEEIKDIPDIRSKNFEEFQPYLEVK
ncbi:MAG: helix-hairpin-helix domain-containing protein [Candidatus Omnitrophica bacterium]|nr:helix-hairpin-helix domain-containing protein [Candidatus Omnitrophota bacterium]